jgi:hypothetical protein
VKTFERVLFLAGFLFLDVFTTRHIYHLWLAPRSSVLDQFTNETEGAIASATSIDALIARYRPVHAAVQKLEQQNQGKPPDQWRFDDQEPFKTEHTLRQAIEDWEEKQHEIFEMRVYWALGLLATAIGFFIHTRFSQWLGIALLGTGLAEMIFWCSPTWFSRATAETDRLLVNKLLLSLATFLLFMTVARFLGLLRNTPKSPEAPANSG